MRPRTGLVAFVAATMVFASACSAGSVGSDDDSDGAATSQDSRLDDLYKAAKSEGGVVWYSALVDDLNARIVDRFKATYPGIDVKVLRLGGAESAQRFAAEAEAGAPAADVMVHTERGFSQLALDNGWTIDMTAEEVPTLEDFPEDFVGGGRFVVNQAPTTVVVNTDLVKKDLTSFEDLLAPEYKGQVLVVDPRTIPIYLAQYELMREDLGDDYFAKLMDNDAKIVDSMVPGGQMLAAGEAKVGIPGVWAICKSLVDSGAPVKCVEIAPMTAVDGELILTKEAAHPNAARLFAGWVATEEGQEIVNAEVSVSPLGDLEGTVKRNPAMVPPDFDAAEQNRATILAGLGLD